MCDSGVFVGREGGERERERERQREGDGEEEGARVLWALGGNFCLAFYCYNCTCCSASILHTCSTTSNKSPTLSIRISIEAPLRVAITLYNWSKKV